MTYVAEPYLYVADQVLTALTGGIARETHRFFAGANAFSFEIPAAQVLPDSVRVIGQAGLAFFSFQIGTDFAIGGDGLLRFLAMPTDPTTPAKGATWPDEATEIYVSYYHADSFKAPLTDRNVGSLTRTLGEAFARELAVLRTELEFVYRSGFVDTAEGTALDMVVALWGIARKTGDFASGTVRFYRDTPAPADVFIPAGTKVSTALPPAPAPASGGGSAAAPNGAPAKPVSFVTTGDRTLRRGQLAVEAPIRAEAKGAPGVVDAGAIAVVNQTVLGINGVMNDAATVFGGAGETDEELRGRAKSVAERAGRATPRALLNALTGLSAIKPNDVNVAEDLTGMPGVVSISVAVDPSAQLASDVHDAILDARPAGIRVVTNLDSFLPPVTAPTASTGTALRDPGSAGPIGAPVTGATADGFKIPLTASAVIFPLDPRITGAPRSALQQAAMDTVTGDVAASSVGGVIVYNQLTADLMGIPGVYDVVLEISPKPAPGGPASAVTKANIYVPADRRATLDAADVKVTFAGAPVYFDFALAVTSTAPATLDAITAEVRTRLGAYLEHPPVANTVDGATLVAKLSGSDLFTFNAADLTWTAEYQKAGLLIRNQGGPGAQTVMQEGDQPVLRLVTVTERQS
ncbi:MAG: baseplate J/gp47 family protein [Acidimicrobiales bacterium]